MGKPERRRFTADEYERLGRAGVLDEDERVELLEGEIIAMPPIGSDHAACVDRTTFWFAPRVGTRAIVRVQSPIRLSPSSEPQPDIALLRPRDDFYREAHPGPADVLLIIEVADTTLAYDRDTKLPLYAVAGIAMVWLVDLQGRRITVYRDPAVSGYRSVAAFERGPLPAPPDLPDLSPRVEDLLP
jgi:Uma2 family endonuclease